MAKKPTTPARKNNNSSKTAVRNTAIPRLTPRASIKGGTAVATKQAITREQIAERAYFISISGKGGSQEENWHRAERELRAERERQRA